MINNNIDDLNKTINNCKHRIDMFETIIKGYKEELWRLENELRRTKENDNR